MAGLARRPQTPPTRDGSPLLAVIVPMYNEVRTIDAVLERTLSVPLDMQVIAVDDGSTVGTRERLEAWPGRGVMVHRHLDNCGKGSAIRTGLP